MDLDTSDSGFSGMSRFDSEPDTMLIRPNWPDGNKYLTKNFLAILQERLVALNVNFRKFVKEQDPKAGLDLKWMLVFVSEKCFHTIRFIAMQVPRKLPKVAAATDEMIPELEAFARDGTPPDFMSQIDALPNPEWDAVLKGYCRVLEASIECFVIGDSPVYQAKKGKDAAPVEIYRVLRKMVDMLERYPFLRNYQKRLVTKLQGSRSSAVWTKWWTQEAQVNPPPKRKLDELGLDEGAKRRLLKEMRKNRRLDKLLSAPSGS